MSKICLNFSETKNLTENLKTIEKRQEKLGKYEIITAIALAFLGMACCSGGAVGVGFGLFFGVLALTLGTIGHDDLKISQNIGSFVKTNEKIKKFIDEHKTSDNTGKTNAFIHFIQEGTLLISQFPKLFPILLKK